MLRPDEQVFEAMIKGWRNQQLTRNLSPGYVGDQERTVRAFTRHADAMPWQWTPQHVDEWSADLRAVHGCVRSTLRNYQGSVRQFCDFLTNPAYGWSDECLRYFGTPRPGGPRLERRDARRRGRGRVGTPRIHQTRAGSVLRPR
ncbi:hypothetical protein [Streptomyces sp. NPDC048385]|uniref:hypothetical protein n=1 Tax=Streptomyces sp. NPDC048385 TaxID=3155145 RepID=UPI00342425B4